MLYGELGRYPLNITVKLKILSFWSKLIDGKQSKLSSLIYRLLYLKPHGNNTFSWINFVKSILHDCGYSNVWHTGAWGMDFVSSSPLSLLPPSFFKIFI
jgi:hypothetical protein